MANNHFTLKKLIQNGGVFLLLIGITFFILFRNNDPGKLIDHLWTANPMFLGAGIFAMCMFILCESINIGRCLKLLGYNPRFIQCLKYAMVGFFFSSITPSASGGQPMQAYYMHKDKIELSHSALVLLIELASYQFVTVSLALIGSFLQYRLIYHTTGGIRYLLILGVALNVGILIFILAAIFSKKVSTTILTTIKNVLTFFGYSKADEFYKKAMTHITEYQKCAAYFLNHKASSIKIIMTSCVQIISLHSVTYWVYRSLGLTTYSFLTILAMQSVLYITVSALPLPGAVGASESGFLLLFQTLFPGQLLSGGLLLSRGISFYLFVMISGLSLGICSIRKRRQIPAKIKRSTLTKIHSPHI